MAAVVAALPSIPDKSMMPAQKSGTEFLAGSNFRISQDEAFITDSFKSTFKKDYVPWNIDSKPPGSEPPAPANVLTKDDRYFNDKISETRQVYEYRFLEKPMLRNDASKLRGTNFKMDKDLKKFQCYDTTHSLDYPAKQLSPFKKRGGKENPMQSFIPQGDPDKVLEPASNYKDCYRGHDALTTKPAKAPSAHQVGPPTIKGDNRGKPVFGTTNNDTFRGWSLPRVKPFPAPTGTNIPSGDGEKERTMETIHQVSFPEHDMDMHKSYDKSEVNSKLQGTNFKQGDGHGKWNDYRSTMFNSYQPKHGDTVKFLPSKHRNHSDFPEGDNDSLRNSDRANRTTNRFYHGSAPDTKPADIVSGANKRTKSNVWFGEPRLGSEFYDTTTDTVFQPVTVPYAYSRHDFNTRSRVPLDYYANERNNNSTYRGDFENPEQDKLIPNPLAIKNLKESHMRAPLGGERQFSTEHVEQYTPKRTLLVPIDAGRMQRSSVPLGTLSK